MSVYRLFDHCMDFGKQIVVEGGFFDPEGNRLLKSSAIDVRSKLTQWKSLMISLGFAGLGFAEGCLALITILDRVRDRF